MIIVMNKQTVSWLILQKYQQGKLMKLNVVNHRLNLSYKEFEEMGEDLSQTTVGKYSIEDELGKGGFGKVYKAYDSEKKQHVAIKVIDIAKIHKEPHQKLRSIKLELVSREDVIMRICDSINLIKCYDVYENQSLKLMMIEYCDGGTLQDYIDNKGRIAQKEAIIIFKQILNGLAELHSRKIIHRDLKSENIMIHNGVFKIADFGFSKQLDEQDQISKHTTLGTITNMAPEVMRRQPYGLKADVWSVGVILFQMVFGDFPFSSRDKASLLSEISGSSIFKQNRIKCNKYTASVQMSNFLRRAISVDQQARFSWKEMISHPLLKVNDQLTVPRSGVVHVPIVDISTLDEETQSFQNNFQSLLNRLKVTVSDSDKIITKRGKKKESQVKVCEEDESYKKMNDFLVQCLKIELIYQQIISQIEQKKMLDMDERENVELMYLLITRCFLSISPIQEFMSQKDKSHLFISQTYPIIKQLYAKISHLFEKYSKMLTKEENKIGNIISDFFQSKKKLEENNRYMNGIEKLDFQKEDQLRFIQNKYIKEVKLMGDGAKVKRYMNIYTQINMIEYEHLKKTNFDDYIEQML